MGRGLLGLEGAQGHCPRVPNQQEGPLPPGSLFSQLLGQNLSWGWGMGEEWRHTGHGAASAGTYSGWSATLTHQLVAPTTPGEGLPRE